LTRTLLTQGIVASTATVMLMITIMSIVTRTVRNMIKDATMHADVRPQDKYS
jgi:hypothetical protein